MRSFLLQNHQQVIGKITKTILIVYVGVAKATTIEIR